jgi:hypothetical protein
LYILARRDQQFQGEVKKMSTWDKKIEVCPNSFSRTFLGTSIKIHTNMVIDLLVPSFHDKMRNTTYSPRILMIHINHLFVEAPNGAIWHILTKPFAWWASSVQVFIDQWIYKPINEANSMKQWSKKWGVHILIIFGKTKSTA